MSVVNVRHITTYTYRNPVGLGEHRLMLRPRDSWDQRLLDASLRITPEPRSVRWVHDVFGNCVTVVTFTGRTDVLEFDSSITLDHRTIRPLEFPIAEYALTYPFSYDPEEMPDLLRSIERQYPDRDHRLYAWARQFVDGGAVDTRGLLRAMTHATREGFRYVRRDEMGVQDPVTTLRLKSGSCRDFAVLMMEAARSLGLAARFVSGYLHMHGNGEEDHVGGGSTHAWVEVYIPGAGWMEFDPTNGILGNRDLIRVAVARDPIQAVPVAGTYDGEASDYVGLAVDVQISSPEPSGGQTAPQENRREDLERLVIAA
jgi:transglutaminase-like putative cysteine protease